jgi:RimJ/RimL family protein N-acetyltransferase
MSSVMFGDTTTAGESERRHRRGVSRWPRLDTERLFLRPFSESDLDAYTAVLQTEPVRTSLHLPDTVGSWDAWSQMAAWLGQW